jgi:peptidoglycan/xylan/chitin deacetylase (PgdA/CDA1 family)
MCEDCTRRDLSRRTLVQLALGGGVAGAIPAAASAQTDVRVEPLIRLASPPAGQRMLALTFDACPGGFDRRIADVLLAERIPATIFVTALWMRRNPEGIALFLAHPDLFAIENHGELHIPPVLGTGRVFGIPVAGDLPTVQREVSNGARAIQSATGKVPGWYRAATGLYSPSVIPAITAMGFAIGGYTYSADAGASLPAVQVTARMMRAKNGDVIVAHINQPRRASGAGVAGGLIALKRAGATFVRLDQAATAPV